MTLKRVTIFVILSGLVVGIAFSILTAGTEYTSSTFLALATVQGAFVGIVFSIFVLASQLSATEYTPLTLEYLSESNTFAGLLIYYAFSILTSIYFIQSGVMNLDIPIIPNSWNIAAGIGTGLAAISLLSLLIARKLLVKFTSPEYILNRIGNSINVSDIVTKSDFSDENGGFRPDRTPLLTIERMLLVADRRDDEFTVQQAINQMYLVSQRVISTPDAFLSIGEKDSSDEYDKKLDVLLDRWSTCLEKGKQGPVQRRTLLIQTHKELLKQLLILGRERAVQNNLNGLSQVCTEAYLDGFIKEDFLDAYDDIFRAAVDSNAISIIAQVRTELFTIIYEIDDSNRGSQFKLESRHQEYISLIFSKAIEYIGVSVNNISKPQSRNFADTTLNQMNSALNTCINDQKNNQDEHDVATYNILTEVHQSIVSVIKISVEVDPVITRRLMIALAELSVSLNKDPALVSEEFDKNEKQENWDKNKIIDICEELAADQNIEREITAVPCAQKEVETFLSSATEGT